MKSVITAAILAGVFSANAQLTRRAAEPAKTPEAIRTETEAKRAGGSSATGAIKTTPAQSAAGALRGNIPSNTRTSPVVGGSNASVRAQRTVESAVMQVARKVYGSGMTESQTRYAEAIGRLEEASRLAGQEKTLNFEAIFTNTKSSEASDYAGLIAGAEAAIVAVKSRTSDNALDAFADAAERNARAEGKDPQAARKEAEMCGSQLPGA